MRIVIRYFCGAVLCWTTTISASAPADLARLFYGEVLFESLRGHSFDALVKLNTGFSPYVDIDNTYQGNKLLPNSLSVTDLQLEFGLSQLAKKNITSRLHNNNHPREKNHNAYQLARFYYKNHQPVDAINALDMIQNDFAKDDHFDIQYLRALAYIRVGKFSAATEILENLPGDTSSREYIKYNLGLTQLHSGNEEKGIATLSSLGQIKTSDPELLALKDKVNLKLGYRYLESGKPGIAKTYFKRVQLESPFTNQALLGSGWASFSLGQVERAIVPWTLLHEDKALNDSVIEAKMALPYAYAKLGAHGRAANLYGHAIDTIESETTRLDAAMDAIRNGKLTQILLDEFGIQDKNWIIDLLRQTESPQQYFLPLLFTTDQFRQLAETMHNLALIKNRLEQWQTSINAYNEFVVLKQKHYLSTLPEAEKSLLKIHKQINNILAKTHQQTTGQNNIQNLEVTQIKQAYATYLEIRKAETKHNQQLPDYKQELSKLSNKIKQLNNRLDVLISKAGKQIETVAIDTLEDKRNRLETYRVNALFALAESYDFATRKQQ